MVGGCKEATFYAAWTTLDHISFEEGKMSGIEPQWQAERQVIRKCPETERVGKGSTQSRVQFGISDGTSAAKQTEYSTVCSILRQYSPSSHMLPRIHSYHEYDLLSILEIWHCPIFVVSSSRHARRRRKMSIPATL